jgi:hypothetical protein
MLSSTPSDEIPNYLAEQNDNNPTLRCNEDAKVSQSNCCLNNTRRLLPPGNFLAFTTFIPDQMVCSILNR